MQLIQVIVIIFALFVLSRIILRLKDNKLTISEFIMWVAVWGSIILVAFIPSIASIFAKLFGIGRGVDLLIYISLIVLFYLIFRIIIKLESIQQEITSIVRKLSLEKRKK